MTFRFRWVLLAATGLALAGSVSAWVLWRGLAAPPTALLRTDDAQLLEQGRKVYVAQCASCHGINREGQANWRERGADGRLPAPPHDETGHTWHHPDELLFRITKEGVAQAAGLQDYESNMPTYGAMLSDADIVAVLSWIKSQWPPDIQATHDGINRQARESQR